jgi:pyruvate formate lyase activating enzyme
MRNLALLLSLVSPERVLVRLPLIPEFNDEVRREESRARLAAMGVTRFDLFSYKIKE